MDRRPERQPYVRKSQQKQPPSRTTSGRPVSVSRETSGTRGTYVRGSAKPQPRRPKRRRRLKRPRRDYTLFFMGIIAGTGRAIKAGCKHLSKTRYFRLIALAGVTLAFVFAIIGVMSLVTRPNALEVFLDETLVGVMHLDGRRDIDHDYIILHAQTRLQSRYGSAVQLSGEITANPVRSRDGLALSFDGLMTALLRDADYYVHGATISINGVYAASVASVTHAEELLAQIIAPHIYDMPYLDSYEFVEDVAIAQTLVHHTNVLDSADVMAVLTTFRPVRETHVVQSGDSLYGIAISTGMGMNALLAANPEIDSNAVLRIGQILSVTRMLPTLSVRTFQRMVIEEAIPAPVENIPAANLATGLRNIVQQGRDGLRRVTIDIVRVNGDETERRIVYTEILEEPTAEIAHVGS